MRRATLRGDARTPLKADADVLICGASFAGLAAARELKGRNVLIVDRYEIGERATSACAAPTPWLHAMGVQAGDPPGDPVHGLPHAARIAHASGSPGVGRASTTERSAKSSTHKPTPALRSRRSKAGPATRSTRTAATCTAPLIIDALGWKRVLANTALPAARRADLERPRSPPARRIRRSRRVDRPQPRPLRLRLERPGRRASSGSASAPTSPRHHVKEPTKDIAQRLERDAVRYQGNWFPHRLQAGHRGRRVLRRRQRRALHPALRARASAPRSTSGSPPRARSSSVLDGDQTTAQALRRYARFSRRHAPAYALALQLQNAIPRLPPKALTQFLRLMGRERLCRTTFGWYLTLAHPNFANAQTRS